VVLSAAPIKGGGLLGAVANQIMADHAREQEVAQETRPGHTEPAWCYDKDHSWHWLVSERASSPSLCEWMDGFWYPASETGAVDPGQMSRRGWRWHSQVKVPKTVRTTHPTRGDLKKREL
jgi:hypothetical protein